MKWSFLLLLAIGAACTMAMPVMELSTEDAGAEMIELAEQPKKVAPPAAKKQAPVAPKKAAPQVPEEKKKAPAVPKRSDKPHADHSEVHKPHGAPKAEEPKKAIPKGTKPKKAPVAPKKATPATPAVPKKAVPAAPSQVKKAKKVAPKKHVKKVAPKKHVKKASAKGLEPGSPAAAKESLQKEAIKAAGVHLGEAPQDKTDKPVPKMPCGYPFKPCSQNEKQANTKADPYDEGDTMTVELKAHLAAGNQAHKDPLNTFATPELKLKRSEEIAKRIFDKANGKVTRMNQSNDSNSAVEAIKTKFAKSIAYVKGLLESAKSDESGSKQAEGEQSAEGGDEESEQAKETAAQVAAMASPLKAEDDKLVKALPQKPTPEAIAEAEAAAKRHMKP